jgi:hypothetical protein
MCDLSYLNDGSFDLVYGTGAGTVPDLNEAFAGVARMSRSEGVCRQDFVNSATEFIVETDWSEVGYRITKPYVQRERLRRDVMLELINYLDEVFNRLLDHGFTIR